MYLLWWFVRMVDEMVGAPFPGLGLVIVLASVTGVGFLLSNVLGRRLVWAVEQLMTRVPLVKLLYNSLRDVVEAFVGEKKTFGTPVSFQLTSDSPRLFGFQTREDLPALGLAGHVAVYVPQAYNIGGQVMAVPVNKVTVLDVPASELLTFTMSGGASGLASIPQEARD